MANYQDAFQRIDTFIEREINLFNSPGIAIGLTDNGATLSEKTYGLADLDAPIPVTSQTLFQIGSISKSFTSIVLLQLQEQGLVDLHAPLTRYLPWFEITSDHAPITLHHLMSHTGGIIMGSDATPSSFTETWNLRHTRATAPPGEMFHYSNSGYKALGLVLEAVLGQSLEEILIQRVIEPLGMSDTAAVINNDIRSRLAVGYVAYFDDRPLLRAGPLAPAPWFEVDTADGSIASTAGDMCRYLRFLLNRGAGLLEPESFQQLISPVIPTGDGLHGDHYGLGLFTFQIKGHQVIGHSGGMVGFAADMLADLDADLGLIVLTNRSGNPERISQPILGILQSAQEGNDLFLDIEDDSSIYPVGDYAGRFQCDDKVITLTPLDEQLYLEIAGDRVHLEPRSPDIFLVPHQDFEMFPLCFGQKTNPGEGEGDHIVEVFHGPDWYVRSDHKADTTFNIPPEWQAYAGHYRAYNPWLTNFKVLIQKDSLVLFQQLDAAPEPLYQTGPAAFRVGKDPRSPEFIQFDLIINDKAWQANYSGGIYSRVSTI